ncbi:sensor histidine kinase [Streptomyces inhibens]|uniref:sensor histidine kinase n=1 Tax=Streptomyces inhibens TaxID=2293571 RepID=UPI0037A3D1FE
MAASILTGSGHGLGATAVVALLVGLYTVSAHGTLTCAAVSTAAFAAWAAFVVLARTPTVPPEVVRGVGLFMTGVALTVVGVGVNIQNRRVRLAMLKEQAARLETERDQQAELAVAIERTRIAREVHDIVTHSLSVMVVLSDGAAATASAAPHRAETAMRLVSATGRQAIGEMNRLLGALRADEPQNGGEPQPGIARLEDLLDEVRATGLPTRLTSTVSRRPCPWHATRGLPDRAGVPDQRPSTRRHPDRSACAAALPRKGR